MLNLILTICFIHLSPLWIFSGITGNDIFDLQQNNKRIVRGPEILGESDKKGEQDFSKNGEDSFSSCNLLPTGITQSGYMPIRKKGVSDLRLWAGSSVAVDVDSGTILHYYEGRKRTQIASLTKMMTAILVMEHIDDLDKEVVTIPKDGLLVAGTVVGCPTSVFCNGNRMYVGEKVRANDLLKAMLLNSANDAATSLGMHIAGGSPQKFVEMMNDKAKDLGLKDTHFCTPSGLEIDGQENQCYSSAYDIARIAAYSLKYEQIWDIMRIQEDKFYSVDKRYGNYEHNLKNTDLLLDSIPNCLGGKTGFTPMAGKSLLLGSVDQTGKHRIISVVLNDENRWDDMKILTNWVFNSYEWK